MPKRNMDEVMKILSIVEEKGFDGELPETGTEIYTFKMLEDAGFLDYEKNGDAYLTWEGHELLSTLIAYEAVSRNLSLPNQDVSVAIMQMTVANVLSTYSSPVKPEGPTPEIVTKLGIENIYKQALRSP